MSKSRFNIASAFRNKAEAMRASFLAIRDVTNHPTTLGDQGEGDWVGLIRDFLPTRYTVGPIFAVDCHGSMSEQIDVGVYDTHFSPQWFGTAGGIRFVPVESVYAVFEAKPEFNTSYVEYAQKKVASVRRLERTSQAVVHKGGIYETKTIDVMPIIGGILTTKSGLANPLKSLPAIQPDQGHETFLNIGICLESFSFDYTPTPGAGKSVRTELEVCDNGDQLIHFATRLFRQLQAVGSVPAVNMTAYEAQMQSPNTETE